MEQTRPTKDTMKKLLVSLAILPLLLVACGSSIPDIHLKPYAEYDVQPGRFDAYQQEYTAISGGAWPGLEAIRYGYFACDVVDAIGPTEMYVYTDRTDAEIESMFQEWGVDTSDLEVMQILGIAFLTAPWTLCPDIGEEIDEVLKENQ